MTFTPTDAVFKVVEMISLFLNNGNDLVNFLLVLDNMFGEVDSWKQTRMFRVLKAWNGHLEGFNQSLKVRSEWCYYFKNKMDTAKDQEGWRMLSSYPNLLVENVFTDYDLEQQERLILYKETLPSIAPFFQTVYFSFATEHSTPWAPRDWSSAQLEYVDSFFKTCCAGKSMDDIRVHLYLRVAWRWLNNDFVDYFLPMLANLDQLTLTAYSFCSTWYERLPGATEDTRDYFMDFAFQLASYTAPIKLQKLHYYYPPGCRETRTWISRKTLSKQSPIAIQAS